MYQKQDILNLLQENGISFEITEHAAIYNMEEAGHIQFPYPDREAKNLFVRDDKKRNYYMITIKGNQKIDLKWFRQTYGTRPLSFANDAKLMEMLQLEPGSVTPFGLFNDTSGSIKLFLDESLLQGNGLIGVHPNTNTATIWMRTNDLITILQDNGHTVELIKLQ